MLTQDVNLDVLRKNVDVVEIGVLVFGVRVAHVKLLTRSKPEPRREFQARCV
jgi:hypothetical protein